METIERGHAAEAKSKRKGKKNPERLRPRRWTKKSKKARLPEPRGAVGLGERAVGGVERSAAEVVATVGADTGAENKGTGEKVARSLRRMEMGKREAGKEVEG